MGSAPQIRRAPAPPARFTAGIGAATRDFVIPYEHTAVFEVTGRPGNVLQDVITVSPDGVFVAVAMSYGFDEERGRDLTIAIQNPADPLLPGDVVLGDLSAAALMEGFRLNPASETVVFKPLTPVPARRNRELTDQPLPKPWLRTNLVQRVKAPEEISFLFSMVDSATGRELQDEPVHNLASLGKSNGERPFRQLAQPLTFLPRSTLRIQVIENSEGTKGRLHVVLFGYKVLGATTCPESLLRTLALSGPVAPARPGAERIVPFDYVMTFPLVGRPGNRVIDEIAINVEGGFVAETLGYGLATEGRAVPFSATAQRLLNVVAGNPIPVPTIPLKALPTSALIEGVRVRPEMVRLAFQAGGQLTASLPATVIDELFESLNRPGDASFLYSLFDSGTGRELQNRPIHNIAGLGIANGDRPFKRFARPLVFLPRSTLRVEIEERFGRGTLFLAFQGYRLLGAGPGRARP